MLAFLALGLTFSACACLYLVSPNQKWLGRPLARKPFLAAGLVLLAGGLWCSMAWMHPLAGLFATLHIVMACLVALPYIAAFHAAQRES